MELKQVISKIQENKNSNMENPMSFIERKSYIPLLSKREIVKVVCQMCLVIDEETELLKCDYVVKDLFTTLNKVLEYSDIEVDDLFDDNGDINIETSLEAYDLIMENELEHYIDAVDMYQLDYLIDNEIEQSIQLFNSTANVLKQTIGGLMEKIPSEADFKTLMQDLPKQLKTLNSLQVLGGNEVKTKPTKSKSTPKKKVAKKDSE